MTRYAKGHVPHNKIIDEYTGQPGSRQSKYIKRHRKQWNKYMRERYHKKKKELNEQSKV